MRKTSWRIAQGDIVTSLISLYKALGGGWEVRCRGFRAQETMTQDPGMIEELPPPMVTPPAAVRADESLPTPPEIAAE